MREALGPGATVAVTGATGFIGSHAVEALLARGYRVRCLVRPERSDLRWLRDSPAEVERVRLSDEPAVRQALSGCDAVVHIAGVTRAKRRRDFFHGNVALTRTLLTASRDAGTVRAFCFMSSLTATGPSPAESPATEQSPCHPITAYGASKLEAEQACREFEDHFRISILRPPAVYGPRDGDILHMFRWIKFGLLPVMGNDHKLMSMLYVTDLARAVVSVLEADREGSTFVVSDPEVSSYHELAETAASLLGTRIRRLPVPVPLVYLIAGATQAVTWLLPKPSVVNLDKVRDLLAAHWICNPAKIRREIGYSTEVRPSEGLERTLAWYRKMKWL